MDSDTIQNCIIYDNLGPAIRADDAPTIVNCIICFNDGSGIDSDCLAPIAFRNNILAFNTGYGLSEDSLDFSGHGYMDFWENQSGNWDHDNKPDITLDDINSFEADPLFVDSDSRDFHLQEGSSCIDAGDPDPSYNDPDGTRNDIGAYGGPYGNDWAAIPPQNTTTTAPVTTTVPITTTTTTTAIIYIEVSPSIVYRSRWISIPYIMTIKGTNTNFKALSTKVAYTGHVTKLPRIVLGKKHITQLIFVNPKWSSGTEEETVVVTVRYDGTSLTDTFEINLCPLGLDEKNNSLSFY
jgi:hypothetical protein